MAAALFALASLFKQRKLDPVFFLRSVCQEGLVWPGGFQGFVFMDYFSMFPFSIFLICEVFLS